MSAIKHAIIPCPDCDGDGCIEVAHQGFIDASEPTCELLQCLTCAGTGEVLDHTTYLASPDLPPYLPEPSDLTEPALPF